MKKNLLLLLISNLIRSVNNPNNLNEIIIEEERVPMASELLQNAKNTDEQEVSTDSELSQNDEINAKIITDEKNFKFSDLCMTKKNRSLTLKFTPDCNFTLDNHHLKDFTFIFTLFNGELTKTLKKSNKIVLKIKYNGEDESSKICKIIGDRKYIELMKNINIKCEDY